MFQPLCIVIFITIGHPTLRRLRVSSSSRLGSSLLLLQYKTAIC